MPGVNERRSPAGEEGRLAFVQWLRAKYPLLPVNPDAPTYYPVVALIRCDYQRGFRPVERVELVDAHIVSVRDDGTLVWEYRKMRVRPWWRALYRWVRALLGRPLPPWRELHEARRVGPQIQRG